jgi:hypothetical protein
MWKGVFYFHTKLYEKHEGPVLKVAPTFIEGSIKFYVV